MRVVDEGAAQNNSLVRIFLIQFGHVRCLLQRGTAHHEDNHKLVIAESTKADQIQDRKQKRAKKGITIDASSLRRQTDNPPV